MLPHSMRIGFKTAQSISYPTTIRVDSNGTYNWNESADVSFSGTTSGAATLGITGNIINQVKKYDGDFQIQWKYRVPAPNGTNAWNNTGTTSHTVYVTYGSPSPGGSATTVKRIDWACNIANDTNTITSAAVNFRNAIASSPGYSSPRVWNLNSWLFLSSGEHGDCITLAKLAREGLEMIGISADYCWSYPTADGHPAFLPSAAIPVGVWPQRYSNIRDRTLMQS